MDAAATSPGSPGSSQAPASPDTASPPAGSRSVQLCLLGRFELRNSEGSTARTLSYDKAGILLALLALRSGAWERETLALLLWPDSETAQARANLRRALFDLRELLAPLLPEAVLEQLLSTTKRSIELRTLDALEIDCRRFHLAQLDGAADTPDSRLAALRLAQRLYRGPLLPQLPQEQAPAVASWLQPLREALHRQALRCLDRLAELLEIQGDEEAALAVAHDSLALDPWDEAALRRCMRLLGRGRRDEALRLFQDYTRRLDAELGLSPQDETRAVLNALYSVEAPAPRAEQALQRRRVLALVLDWRAPPDETLAAEGMLATLSDSVEQAAARLRACGATVRPAEGAELLAFFGHPVAQEHAIRHALDLTLELLAEPTTLQLRAGLHVAWVHARQDDASPDTLGELSREARRLSWLALPGEAQVSPALLALARRHHRFAAPQPEGHARLLGALALQHRWAEPPRLAMVGRETELAALCQAWKDAQNGVLAVWLQGEPGLGKTRLMQALRDRLRRQAAPPRLTLLHCLPEFSQSPLQPVLAVLRQILGRQRGSAPEQTLQALAARFERPTASLTPLAALFQPDSANGGIKLPRSRELFAQLIALLDAWGKGQPQLLMIEDLHWADPSTLELIERYLNREAQATPTLLLLSSREPPPLNLATKLRLLELQPLSDGAMRQLATQLHLPEEPRLLQCAQGVPLFAEELANSWQALPEGAVPATLWDLLAARLDRLAPAPRRVAQVAAVLGSDWDGALLQATLGAEASQRPLLDLQRLQAAGLLQSRANGRWQFRHALQRDAAYQSLSASDKRQLHRRAADALLGPLASAAADEPARLAHHLTVSGDPLAAFYWLQAGRRAAAQSAHQEACHMLEQGLAMLDKPGAQPEMQRRLHPALLQQLAFSRLALEGYGSQAARRLFEQAKQAAEPGDGSMQFQILWGLWLGSRSGPDTPPALQLSEQLRALAEQTQDAGALVQAYSAMGNARLFAGQLHAALQTLRHAAEAGERLPAQSLALRFGEHGGIAARALMSWALAWLGQIPAALDCAQTALRQARELAHPHTLAYTLAIAAVLQRQLRAPQALRPLAQELDQLAERHGMLLWQAAARAHLGWLLAWEGKGDEGLALISAAIAKAAIALPSKEATFHLILCEALLLLTRPAEALHALDHAQALAEERQEPYLLAALWRMRAEALQALNAPLAELQQAQQQARALAEAMRSSGP
ncbi:BTAD domain-containing putative transcriptional regulator [Paucibacter sp. APW11]|uniref:BTAD domain-containing putative transcriptional regulator n=1 Tax=Roseateles aquae TaxID=3077235 RepID=A0ABU3PB42_9BURK|nr:AAA family ATPase [Paucibacter sp. APW11]MDT8999755.1 BTAD domain-containing putative transcriptional regulator [Paucibacter sp. APW11]